MKTKLAILAVLFASGCAGAQFSTVGPDEYALAKMSSACAVGDPASVIAELKQEAEKFCAGRREVPTLTSQSGEQGIPIVRCTSARITFRCAPPK